MKVSVNKYYKTLFNTGKELLKEYFENYLERKMELFVTPVNILIMTIALVGNTEILEIILVLSKNEKNTVLIGKLAELVLTLLNCLPNKIKLSPWPIFTQIPCM